MKLQRLAPLARFWPELSSKCPQCLAPIRNTPSNERHEVLTEINRTDSEIDNRVYDLDGLTEDERSIVGEGNSLE
jgi:hypothetical protein